MSCIKSFSVVVAAAEAMIKGADISHYTRSDLSRYFDDVSGTYNVLVDDAVKDMFKLSSHQVYREGKAVYAHKEDKEDFTADLTLDMNRVKEIMQALWEIGIESFIDFKEEDFIVGYEELMKAMDKNFDFNLEMKEELSRAKTDEALRIFLALFDYPNNYSKILYDDSKTDKVFHLNKAKDFEIIDNRMYIPIKPSIFKKIEKRLYSQGFSVPSNFRNIKAFVVSKNVYDYFWASYGNEFQSCFALNSDYGYLYGYLPFAAADESFICYATTGDVNKIPIISGKQFKCPNMMFRCWGYADDEGHLLVDKKYLVHSTINDAFVEAFLDVLKPYVDLLNDKGQNQTRNLYNNGEGIEKVFNDVCGSLYADSLRFGESGNVEFKYANGSCVVGKVKMPWADTHKKFTDYASTVTSVSPSLSLEKKCAVINGVLMNPKTCPVTGFDIPDEEVKSPYAKFFTTDCTRSAMITYINGQVFLDELTSNVAFVQTNQFVIKKRYSWNNDRRGFYCGTVYIYPYNAVPDSSNKSITLNTLKEMLRGAINSMNLDGLLLRYFEGNEVKYQFYKHRK